MIRPYNDAFNSSTKIITWFTVIHDPFNTQIHYLRTQLLARFQVHTIDGTTKPMSNWIHVTCHQNLYRSDTFKLLIVLIDISNNRRICIINIISLWLTMNLKNVSCWLLTDRLKVSQTPSILHSLVNC